MSDLSDREALVQRLEDALIGRDDTGNHTVVTRSLLMHLLSEALAALRKQPEDYEEDYRDERG